MIRIIKGDNAIMKKSVLSILLAAILILSLCAACGQSAQTEAPVAESETFERATPAPAEETPAPTDAPAEETPAPTDAPEITPEPEIEHTAESTPAGNDSSSSNQNTSGGNSGGNTAAAPTAAPTATPAQDKRSVALDMVGASVSDLYAAVGSPNSTSYTESCLVIGGQDGFLYYDNFTVETIRRADGSELVYDVY